MATVDEQYTEYELDSEVVLKMTLREALRARSVLAAKCRRREREVEKMTARNRPEHLIKAQHDMIGRLTRQIANIDSLLGEQGY